MKNVQKNAALAFYDAFYVQNLVKNRENPYFSLKREYLKITPKLVAVEKCFILLFFLFICRLFSFSTLKWVGDI